MPYSPPTFNLICDIYSIPLPATFGEREYRQSSECQLAPPTRGAGSFPSVGSITGMTQSFYWSVRFPALTDVRDPSVDLTRTDFIECPAGSGRWYFVCIVDDVAKGFPNEYRIAIVRKSLLTGGQWPIPIP